MKKPSVTATTHVLPFSRLDPLDFERLCLWLVDAEGFDGAEHYGLAGNEQGRDVIAHLDKELWYFQCKRHKAITSTTLIDEVDKISTLSETDQSLTPTKLVFVISSAVSADIRDKARLYCTNIGLECEFWAETELDLKVKKYPDIVREFFGITSSSISENTNLLENHSHAVNVPHVNLFVGRTESFNELQEAIKSHNTIVIHGISGIGKSYFVAQAISKAILQAPIIWIDCQIISGIEECLLYQT